MFPVKLTAKVQTEGRADVYRILIRTTRDDRRCVFCQTISSARIFHCPRVCTLDKDDKAKPVKCEAVLGKSAHFAFIIT